MLRVLYNVESQLRGKHDDNGTHVLLIICIFHSLWLWYAHMARPCCVRAACILLLIHHFTQHQYKYNKFIDFNVSQCYCLSRWGNTQHSHRSIDLACVRFWQWIFNSTYNEFEWIFFFFRFVNFLFLFAFLLHSVC